MHNTSAHAKWMFPVNQNERRFLRTDDFLASHVYDMEDMHDMNWIAAMSDMHAVYIYIYIICIYYISMITLSMMMHDSQLLQTTTWTPRRCKQGTWRHSVALGTSDAAFVRQSQTWSDVLEEYWKTLPTDQYEDPLEPTIKGLFSILGFPLSDPTSLPSVLHQLRLVAYPIIFKGFIHPKWLFEISSINSKDEHWFVGYHHCSKLNSANHYSHGKNYFLTVKYFGQGRIPGYHYKYWYCSICVFIMSNINIILIVTMIMCFTIC